MKEKKNFFFSFFSCRRLRGKTKMNISMGQLVNDARDLVARLKEREKNVDQVVSQSNALAKKFDAIQQVIPKPNPKHSPPHALV